MPLSRHDNPDRAGEPRLLVHVGAAHAGRPGRAGSPIQSARAGNLEKRAPGPERSHGACRSPPGRQHQAAPVVARGSAEAGRPSPRRLGADGRSRRTGRALALGGGTSGLAQRPQADSRSAGPLAAGAGLGETRADPPVHSLRTALAATDPGRSNAEPPVRTLQSERLALGSADANGTNRSDGRPAGRHAPMPPSRMAVVVAHSRARVRRAEVDPRRRLKPTTTAPLGCSRSVRLRWGTRCTAAMSAALRCTRCDRLHRAVAVLQRGAVGCNRLSCIATGCHALQQIVHAVLRPCCCAALHSLQQVAPDCGLLQRAVLGCNGRPCIATGFAAVQQVLLQFVAHCGCTVTVLAALRCNGIDHWCLHCVALAAPGCGKVWSVASDGTALHQAPLNCNQPCCYLWRTVAAL